MRYAQTRLHDISNGDGIGISLFVQGCHFHCENCFNRETWDFEGGKLWDAEIKEDFINLINPNIKRLSILGGEPLALENLDDVLDLLQTVRNRYDYIKIWLYTGYTWEQIFDCSQFFHPQTNEILSIGRTTRSGIVDLCDVVIDGQYEKNLYDRAYQYAGSTNQRVIDVKKTLKKSEVVLWKK